MTDHFLWQFDIYIVTFYLPNNLVKILFKSTSITLAIIINSKKSMYMQQ